MATLHKLTDVGIRKLKPAITNEKHSDGGGLFLLVTPKNVKRWIFRSKLNGKSIDMGFGEYPDVSLAEARQRAADARLLIRDGQNPIEVKKAKFEKEEYEGKTFEEVARELIELKRGKVTEQYRTDIRRSLELHVFPKWPSRPIAAIKPKECVDLCLEIEKNGAYLAHKMAQRLGEIFEFAVSLGYREFNPINKATHKSLKPFLVKNMATIEFERLPELMRAMDEYSGRRVTKLAVEFLLLTFTRTAELRALRWAWVDWPGKMITIPPEYHKTGKRSGNPHHVPLSTGALKVLERAKALTGNFEYIFPSPTDYGVQANNNLILSPIAKMGFKRDLTGHGFRALARSALGETGKFSDAALERQLAHSIGDKTKAAYDRALFLDERRQLMQCWSDMVDSCRP